MPWRFNMFSPAVFKIHQGFSRSAGARRGWWAQGDRLLDCSAVVQSTRARSRGCPIGIFPAHRLCPGIPCSVESMGAAAIINTYFHSSSSTAPLCFRVMLFQAGKKNHNASSYFVKCCLTETGDQKSVLQPKLCVRKACVFSVSHCDHCLVPVSLPPCPSLKHLPSPFFAFERTD